ncbi:AL4A1-like protein [Mya arenaria]|uniref:L-glutamate gamma-semialdehyde dehydrogenase n=1 Tax=Mya arenaria TaxID=6604 RepID=A0ABY7F030_MYAAR|nr:AL4A1-like protein [Mya arenaria]
MPSYAPGTEEREQLDKTVAGYEGLVKDVPIMIGDEEIRSGQPRYQPFDHEKRIAKFTYASKDVIQKAIDNSLKARKDWERQPLEKRAEVFYRASELMKNKYRYDLLATTMIGQGKNIWQAEIDAAAEMIDFLRFNIQFARGFWACITPFNFTAIGGHLPAAPALMIYREAGLPAGVINFIPADGPSFGDTVTSSPHLAGINFTGKCGGKNMHFVHPSAKLDQVFYGAIQSGFEYSGQKCSALSRMYIPESMWPDIKENLKRIHKEMVAFARCKSYLEHAQKSANVKIIVGGKCDDSVGYYIEPTFLEVSNPDEKLLKEEIFGPIVTVYVYPDDKYRETAKKASQTSPFALTGAIYAEDEDVVEELSEIFEDCAGNFYINDKSTGSVAIKRRNVYKKTWKYPSMADTTPGELNPTFYKGLCRYKYFLYINSAIEQVFYFIVFPSKK